VHADVGRIDCVPCRARIGAGNRGQDGRSAMLSSGWQRWFFNDSAVR
jgi:hypothetical protein